MKILAVDLGKARTGLAVCDEGEILASPVEVITQYNREKLAQAVADKAKALAVGEIVVGLPRNMDGSEGESAQGAREFAAALTQQRAALKEMHCPEADYFIVHMLPCYAQPLDELTGQSAD